MTDQVLEWAPFRLKPGVDEATLLESSERLQRDFLARQEGFRTARTDQGGRRRLYRSGVVGILRRIAGRDEKGSLQPSLQGLFCGDGLQRGRSGR